MCCFVNMEKYKMKTHDSDLSSRWSVRNELPLWSTMFKASCKWAASARHYMRNSIDGLLRCNIVYMSYMSSFLRYVIYVIFHPFFRVTVLAQKLHSSGSAIDENALYCVVNGKFSTGKGGSLNSHGRMPQKNKVLVPHIYTCRKG